MSRRKIEIISGERFGALTVIKEVEPIRSQCGHISRRVLCNCDCGKEKVVALNNLRCGNVKSCGCLMKKQMSERMKGKNPVNKRKILNGDTFGRLTVIKEVEPHERKDKKGTRRFFLCQCECGKEKVICLDRLINGNTKSCGCLRKELSAEKRRKNLVGQNFGLLTVVKRVGKGRNGLSEWLCKCECGNTKIAVTSDLTNGKTKSCGCINSIGETKCKNFLGKLGIEYKTQYSFDDLRSAKNALLLFDFAIFKNNALKVLVEYQGEQHKINLEFGKQQREITDPQKKEYCKRHNIPLEEIWFNENIEERINQICNKYLHDNTVPSSQEIA